MDVYGRFRLVKFSNKHAQAKRALDAWYKLARDSIWKTPHDIKARCNSVDFLSGNRVIFDIKGNHYRLVTAIDYAQGAVSIVGVYTHAEYDKQSFG
jgi:mRNA interferase HigB